jgi:hypothetical protein
MLGLHLVDDVLAHAVDDALALRLRLLRAEENERARNRTTRGSAPPGMRYERPGDWRRPRHDAGRAAARRTAMRARYPGRGPH